MLFLLLLLLVPLCDHSPRNPLTLIFHKMLKES